jgi:hypothetical protein
LECFEVSDTNVQQKNHTQASKYLLALPGTGSRKTDDMTQKPPTTTPRDVSPLAGLLSYLIPGLGQVYQGRLAKGILFFVCIYVLFFYGMFLGTGTVKAGRPPEEYRVTTNVYLPSVPSDRVNNPANMPKLALDLYNRPQFLGQFWVGIVAWPAIWQYYHFDPNEKGDRWLGDFMRTPSDAALNALHTSGDKRLELGWVFTVIAGVLNIMVIYDALAGPAFLFPNQPSTDKVAL